MAFSNTLGSMLLSTGNKSELAVGYCTLYGDMCGGLAVISDVPKTLVYDLARYVNRQREIIPHSSLTKAPSAELRPNQTDQDTLPPYEILDRVVEAYVERDQDVATIARLRARSPRRRGHRPQDRRSTSTSDGRRRRASRSRRRHSASGDASPSPPNTRWPTNRLRAPDRARSMLARLRERLDGAPVTRFAPSPTGRLHLGHVVNAIYVWGLARALDGVVRLRIEDHDRERLAASTSAASSTTSSGWDFSPMCRACPCSGRQTVPTGVKAIIRPGTRMRSAACATPALSTGATARVRESRATADDIGPELRYDGRCRDRGLGPGPERGIRVRLDEGEEAFDDARLGLFRQAPAHQCGDLLVRDRLGNWTYQFAVTVDDLVEGITW